MSDFIDRRWMGEALGLARRAAELGEVPVGALIVQKKLQNPVRGDLPDLVKIAEGFNFREAAQSVISHAEILAIINASQELKSWRLESCTLYVTLEPCLMCLGAIQQARISRVVYGAKDPKAGAISLGYKIHEDIRTNHRFIVDYLETPEAGTVLTEFFKRLR